MRKRKSIKWPLVVFDIGIFLFTELLLLVLYQGQDRPTAGGIAMQMVLSFACIFTMRGMGNIYGQVWRYGGIQCYIRLLVTDGMAFVINLFLEMTTPIPLVNFSRLLSIVSIDLLGALGIRMVYRYAYKCGNTETPRGRFLLLLLRIFAGNRVDMAWAKEAKKTKIAIIGAGRVGVSLAEDLRNNPASNYVARCYVDDSAQKIGRMIHGIPVLPESPDTLTKLREYEVQEVVLAIPDLSEADTKRLYEFYRAPGFRVKVYDYPTMQTPDGKRHLREFDIEELLFRKPVVVANEKATSYYMDKVILITGGGGSIGSELSRQLATMMPRQLVLVDIYENGVYDIQQELQTRYHGELDVQVEIVSVTNKEMMSRVFATYHPQIIIHAAAHKHVPLMEHNCVEAVENNVFGTLNMVQLCEEYQAERFMMVSTDKAVNPTNVMGATKRMCEMIVQSASTAGTVKYSATRFGNVLGSAGSVIPLFRKQIAAGGPVTITDKRIIRYFMTIPEATQLVLLSGAMADNGELFVLDMGQPVRILDLAENMIRLSGVPDIEIIETGLRPGEKLYEELLVKTEELDQTENSLIFIERDVPMHQEEIIAKLQILADACATGDNDKVREALHRVIPTYRRPEEVNETAEQTEEMRSRKELASV